MNFASQRLLPPPPAFLFREKLSGKERTTTDSCAAYASQYEREQRFTKAFFLVVPDKITHPRDGIQNAREQKEVTKEKRELFGAKRCR